MPQGRFQVHVVQGGDHGDDVVLAADVTERQLPDCHPVVAGEPVRRDPGHLSVAVDAVDPAELPG